MSNDTFVYRTTKPEVLALHDRWAEDFKVQSRAIKAFKRKWPIKHPGERKLRPLLMSTMMGGQRVIGYSWWSGEVPEGWKYDRKRGVLEPKLSHPLGKQIAADLRKCSLRACRDDLAEFGIVTSQWVGLTLTSPGVEFIEGACYVIFERALEPKKNGQGYDPDIWEPVKLSEFYAAKERNEEKGQAFA